MFWPEPAITYARCCGSYDVDPVAPPTFVSAAKTPSGLCAAHNASANRQLAANAPLVPCLTEDTLSEVEPFLHFGLPLFELLHAILERLEPRGRVFGWLTAAGSEFRDPEDGECGDPHEYQECGEKDGRFHGE